MHSRLHDRIAATLSLVLLATLALFTFYLAQVAEREERTRQPRGAPSNEPDYFVDRLALLSMNERGEPSFRLEAQRLQHFPVDDATVFESPIVVSLDPGRPRLTVTARKGRLLDGGEEAHLSGDVVLTRAASADAAPLRVETDFAVVLPDSEIVRTDRPVIVMQGGQRLSGVGMELDNRTRRLRVDSRVSAVWPAPAAPPAADPAPAKAAR
jgi:lipopolysaccharide export system protein LptC